MLDRLKKFDSDTVSLDEAVALAVFAEELKNGYLSRAIDVPDWLDTQTASLEQTIARMTADAKSKRVREINAQLAGLKTAAEKRADLQAELDKLTGATNTK